MAGVVHVAAAAIFGPDGRLLISRRQAHQHQGGLWEFPGGKVEPGESVSAALCRELKEELDIWPQSFEPLITIPFNYPDKQVLLDVWRVTAYTGTPRGLEGQPLRWVAPHALQPQAFPPANRPIVAALQLPNRCMITGEFDCLDELFTRSQRALTAGVGMLQLRLSDAQAGLRDAAIAALAPLCQQQGALLMVNADPATFTDPRVGGIHLNRHRLARVSDAELAPWRTRRIGASCHNRQELQRAAELGADFALLSPLLPTRSHPDAEGLGWARFGELCNAAALPVFALGGVGEAHYQQVRQLGAQGIAAISAYWTL